MSFLMNFLRLFSNRYPFFYRKLETQYQDLLEENFTFYQKLNLDQRQLFNHRVLEFIDLHTFVGKEGMVVDFKMKLLIAGTAVMLTFGFNHFLYEMFETILVYPEDYYSFSTHLQHKGETNPALGVIVFSWEDFKDGIAFRDDNYHLGLHEFAHALHFSFLTDGSPEANTFITNFEDVLEHVRNDDVRERLENSGYLRDYAFENKYELFAVMVEHFYESPELFREKHPQLFKMMGDLLQIGILID